MMSNNAAAVTIARAAKTAIAAKIIAHAPIQICPTVHVINIALEFCSANA